MMKQTNKNQQKHKGEQMGNDRENPKAKITTDNPLSSPTEPVYGNSKPAPKVFQNQIVKKSKTAKKRGV